MPRAVKIHIEASRFPDNTDQPFIQACCGQLLRAGWALTSQGYEASTLATELFCRRCVASREAEKEKERPEPPEFPVYLDVQGNEHAEH